VELQIVLLADNFRRLSAALRVLTSFFILLFQYSVIINYVRESKKRGRSYLPGKWNSIINNCADDPPPQLPDRTPNPNYQLCGIIDKSGTPLPQLFLAFLKSPEISAASKENS
jgi:hypothetical protein